MRAFSLLSPLCVSVALAGLARAETPVQSSHDHGFVFETDDGAYQLKVGGTLHFDSRMYRGEERGAPHSFDIRRARLDFKGRAYQYVTVRVQAELADTPYLRDAWGDFEAAQWLHLRAGQMKVPFSSAWLTGANNLNFIERPTSTPLYPFFDRGVMLWGDLLGGAAVYNLGAYTGAGIEKDYTKGDIDDSKDVAGRVFLQPFRAMTESPLRGVFLAGQFTWGEMSVPTSRFETGGLTSPNYETAIWKWRTEQTIGTDGRVTDSIGATVGSRTRWGAELHYLLGPFALSAEYAEVRYQDIRIAHSIDRGSTRVAEVPLSTSTGNVRSLSAFASVYVTGEAPKLTNEGWKTADPKRSVGEGGPGAIEFLARYGWTKADEGLFTSWKVNGFAAGASELGSHTGATPGEGNSVTASVLQGADEVHELTLGASWTLNPMTRLQLNNVLLIAPERDRDGDGENDNLMLSGAMSSQADGALKGIPTKWENAVILRLALRI